MVFTKQADKDAKKAAASGFKPKLEIMLQQLSDDPFYTPPPEKLCGNMSGAYSRRINKQHRLVYQVDMQARIIKVLRMWTHYE